MKDHVRTVIVLLLFWAAITGIVLTIAHRGVVDSLSRDYFERSK